MAAWPEERGACPWAMCPVGTLCTLTLALGSMAPPSSPMVSQVPARSGYAGQMFLADAAVFGVAAILGAAGRPAEGEVLAAAGYVFDGPVVHGLHGEGLRALASLGLRLGTPFAAGLAGAAISPCGRPSSDLGNCPGKFGGAVVGLFAGAGIALFIDYLFLARE